MSRKERAAREKTDAAWRAAAEAVGASVAELYEWLLGRPHLYHHTQPSQWATGTPIPERLLIEFLRARGRAETAPPPATAEALRARSTEHVQRQHGLLDDLNASVRMLTETNQQLTAELARVRQENAQLTAANRELAEQIRSQERLRGKQRPAPGQKTGA